MNDLEYDSNEQNIHEKISNEQKIHVKFQTLFPLKIQSKIEMSSATLEVSNLCVKKISIRLNERMGWCLLTEIDIAYNQ